MVKKKKIEVADKGCVNHGPTSPIILVFPWHGCVDAAGLGLTTSIVCKLNKLTSTNIGLKFHLPLRRGGA